MDLETFREETHEWLLANCPPSMRAPITSADDLCWGGRNANYPAETMHWLHVMAERGWTAPTWPRAYGGGGLGREEARILAHLMQTLHIRAPLSGFGLSMIGPLLLQEGTDDLKKQHIPSIVRGEIRWCQGYSEPGSGSDLASLYTRAEVDGDFFVVNGQKVWTSYADRSDWMFLLVRTDPKAKKQDGITFLLMDMESAGVSVRPIKLISGSSPFCETYLENVRVPRASVVGQVNGGWAIAKALLGHERTMIADVFKDRVPGNPLVEMAREYLGGKERIADPILRDAIAQNEMDLACLDFTLERSRDGAKAGHKPGPETSIFKLYGTETNQNRRKLMVDILGPQGLGWDGPGFDRRETATTRDWLRSRGNTIEGGTSEVQLNIIAKRVLGLPD